MDAKDNRVYNVEAASSIEMNKKVSSTSSSSLLAPTIDDFRILKPISRGAFGKVYKVKSK